LGDYYYGILMLMYHVDADEHGHADTERGPSEDYHKINQDSASAQTTFPRERGSSDEYTPEGLRFHQKRMKIVEMDKVKKKTGVEAR
jgi:hypothetical protein